LLHCRDFKPLTVVLSFDTCDSNISSFSSSLAFGRWDQTYISSPVTSINFHFKNGYTFLKLFFTQSHQRNWRLPNGRLPIRFSSIVVLGNDSCFRQAYSAHFILHFAISFIIFGFRKSSSLCLFLRKSCVCDHQHKVHIFSLEFFSQTFLVSCTICTINIRS